jgi:hypothetical protein
VCVGGGVEELRIWSLGSCVNLILTQTRGCVFKTRNFATFGIFNFPVAIYFKVFSEQIKSYTKVVLLSLVTDKLHIVQSGNKLIGISTYICPILIVSGSSIKTIKKAEIFHSCAHLLCYTLNSERFSFY